MYVMHRSNKNCVKCVLRAQNDNKSTAFEALSADTSDNSNQMHHYHKIINTSSKRMTN